MDLKEEALDNQIIQLEETIESLKKRIKDLTLLKTEILGNMDPIAGILAYRQTIADDIAIIRVYLDNIHVPLTRNIVNSFDTTTQSLNEITQSYHYFAKSRPGSR